jgi:hypothetical protein
MKNLISKFSFKSIGIYVILCTLVCFFMTIELLGLLKPKSVGDSVGDSILDSVLDQDTKEEKNYKEEKDSLTFKFDIYEEDSNKSYVHKNQNTEMTYFVKRNLLGAMIVNGKVFLYDYYFSSKKKPLLHDQIKIHLGKDIHFSSVQPMFVENNKRNPQNRVNLKSEYCSERVFYGDPHLVYKIYEYDGDSIKVVFLRNNMNLDSFYLSNDDKVAIKETCRLSFLMASLNE